MKRRRTQGTPPMLHVQTPYSFYEGVGRIEQVVEVARSQNSQTIAFTDRNRVSGLVRGYKTAREAGLRPILGLLLDEPGKPDRYALLWARNLNGYGDLCRLATSRQLEPEFHLVDAISSVGQGTIVAVADCDLLETLRDRLAPGTFFANLRAFSTRQQRIRALKTYDHARALGIPVVATSPITSATVEQASLARLLRAIGERRVLQQGKDDPVYSLDDPDIVQRCFRNVPDALDNAHLIARECDVDLRLGELKFPAPLLPEGTDPFAELRHRSEEGLRRRYGPVPPEPARERLAYELGVIAHLGFAGYMLVVHDIARDAWGKGIRTLGRGSSANSLVCYCLGLTDICPLKYDLYFERFLNPERSSPPDIDLDFSWRDRDSILHNVYDTYGHDSVAMIATTVTFRARAAFHEAALAHGLPEEEISRITKRIPSFSHVERLEDLPGEVPACRELPLDREPWTSIAREANGLLGLPRHLSIHAGGIVITPGPLTEWTALERASKGYVITQYDMYPVEDLGLVKIDLLSQRSLGVLKDTVEMVERNTGEKPPVSDVEDIFLDPATRSLLREGRSMGCFYVESPGMISLLRKLDCDHFELLVAASSVIRPGVSESGMMQQYIERVRDPSKAEYLHPRMRTLLAETHGVMIYQEDVIKVAHHVAGLSLGRADLLRRAMSGKHRSLDGMIKLKDEFIEGCGKNGVEPEIAREIWRQIASFAGYSFCKAHSASFAVLSMQIAYLKAHHPAEFWASVLANGGGFYSQAAYVEQAKREGVRVLLPDINESGPEPCGRSDAIRIGFASIGALRENTVEQLLDERNRNGTFSSLGDFVRRLHPAIDEVEALISCGTFDSFDINRPTLLRNLRAGFNAYLAGPGPLAVDTEDPFADLPPAKDWSEEEKYLAERRILGFSPGTHPLALLDLPTDNTVSARDMERHEGRRVHMVGWAYTHKRITTRSKRETMEFISMEDLTGTFEVTVFPKTYRRFAPILHGNGPFRISGHVEREHGVCMLTADTIERLPTIALRVG
ncbi:MAG: DNA polymerase III subunit alpha [bacterium]